VAVKQLTEAQAEIWTRSINESQEQWSDWTLQAAETLEHGFGDTLRHTFEKHIEDLQKLHEQADSHMDARWQQWQTTLSEQARTIQGQQKELIKQTDALQSLSDSMGELIDSTTDFRKLEETIGDGVKRLENLSSFEEASVCMSEAVAVLATSLERAGLIRGAPIRPRFLRTEVSETTAGDASEKTSQTDEVDELKKGRAA
jgi:hypothetical protein